MDLDQLLDMNSDQLVELFHARARCAAMGSGHHAYSNAARYSTNAQPPSACRPSTRPIRPYLLRRATLLACCRRRFQRGLKRKPLALVKRLRKAKKVRQCALWQCMDAHARAWGVLGTLHVWSTGAALVADAMHRFALASPALRRTLLTARSPTLCAPTCAT